MGVPLALSLLFHLLLFSLFALHFDSNKSPPEPAQPEVMEAVIIDEGQIQAERKRLEAIHETETAARKAELEAQRKAEAEATRRAAEEEEQRRVAAEARLKAEDEAKQQAELQAQRETQAETTRRATEEEEQRRVAAEAKQKAESDAKHQAELEAQREAEAEAAQIAREEAKRRAAAEAKQKAESEAKPTELEIQHNTETEAAKWANSMIKPKVEGRWVKPSSSMSGLSCKIKVTTLPGGIVSEARVIHSSGDLALDQSAEYAVLKASPLPMPADEKVAQELKTFNFNFNP